MHIGIDARLYYYRQAGIGNYVVRLIRALAEIDAEDRFTVFQSWKDKANFIARPNFKRQNLLTPCHNKYEQIALPLELSRSRLDLLHSPDFIPPFRRRCKSVITVHDLAFMIFPEFVTEESRRYYGQIQRAVESAEGIMADSESTREDMVRLLGIDKERVDVVYLAPEEIFKPVDDEQTLTDFRNRFGLPSSYILYVGTIEPRKNLITLLKAYAKLLKGTSIAAPRKLVLVGKKGWLYEDTFKLIESLGLSERVLFIDSFNQSDLVLFYGAANMFVIPSLYEGFGFTPLEAMCCGTPVISSRTSSLIEIVGDGGLLFEPEDVDGLADAMYRVLSDFALRTELRQRGFAQAAKFNWRKTAKETLAVYRRVAE